MNKKKYNIKENYVHNLTPDYYHDLSEEIIYQPEVYKLAYYLAKKSNVSTVIDIGSGNGKKLIDFENEFEVFCVDYGENEKYIKENISNFRFISMNLEDGMDISKISVKGDYIVIMSDVIEHIIEPDELLLQLGKLSYSCKYMLISTPDRIRARGVGDMGPPANKCHVREWTIEEFDALLKEYSFNNYMIGYTINTNFHLQKNNILAIAGTEIFRLGSKIISVLAIINVYNEVDIISDVIENLIFQGVDVMVVDNWSNDGTVKEVKKLINKYKDRIRLRRFPEYDKGVYEWEALLKNTEKIARESTYDWIIHHDADEIRTSPWKNISLRDAISFVDSVGYNAIDFSVLDFRPTNKVGIYKTAIKDNLFFEFGKRAGHFIQIKAWKNYKDRIFDLASSGGHEIKFINRRVYPIKFQLKHYSLRTPEQAKNKIFNERINRFIEGESVGKGWHTQYNMYTLDDQFLWCKDSLINYSENSYLSDFLVERISGIGIVK